jgi:hypothetical protein
MEGCVSVFLSEEWFMNREIICAAFALVLAGCSAPTNFAGAERLSASRNTNSPRGESDTVEHKETSPKTGGDEESSTINNANSASNKVAPPENSIADVGKSLDLYVVVDTSLSLSLSTDPGCKRLGSLATFMTSLRERMGEEGDVRMTLVTFSKLSEAKLISVDPDAIKTTGEAFETRYKTAICASVGGTDPKSGIDLMVRTAKSQIASNPKDVTSVLFFSDGSPTLYDAYAGVYYPSMKDVGSSITSMHELFPSRVFAVLLNDANPTRQCTPFDQECPPSAQEFMNMLTGDAKRVRSAVTAEELAKSLLSLL